MNKNRSALPIWVALVISPMTTGCELLTKLDRSKLYDDPTVTPTTTSSSSGEAGAGGMGGTGGMGGAGGMAGAGGGVTCDSNEACNDQNPCTTETCETGFCVYTSLDGVPTPNAIDNPGDCNKPLCVAGNDLLVPDDNDVPDDGFECTIEACNNGTPSFTDVQAGTLCGVNKDLVCNGQGVCVGCNAPTDCLGQDTVCRTRTCIAGTCGVQDAPDGTFVDEGTVGDCRQTQCNGAGAITIGPKDTDLPPDDGNSCTGETCSGGIAYHPFLTPGTTCNQNGGSFCNGGGACVECVVASTCPGQDTACQTRACNAGTCAMSYEPSGTLLPGQTAGDCQILACNGMGAITSLVDDSDVPLNDGTDCTDESCINGVPAHVNVLETTPCSENGGRFCSSGVCVQCNTSDDCPGMDTECSTRTCNTGMCGNNFTTAGTQLQNQTPGNCQLEQCDGNGGVTSTVDNADLPVDAKECTQDICSSGVASNPPLTQGTSCSQNGGAICNGNGDCVPEAQIVSVTPSDGQTNAAVDAPIRISFSTAMNPATLIGQTLNGPCTGSVQVSADDFTTCLAFASSAPSMNATNDVATFTPAAFFSYLSTYKVRITTAVQSTGNVPISAPYNQNTGFTTNAPPTPCGGSVVISQIYGAGGDVGAMLKNDFVELHNRGNTPVDVTGWSVQYAYPQGSFNIVPNNTTPLSGIIAPGGYYLVQLNGDTFGTVDLPTPDATGATDFDSATGKVALVNTTTHLTGGCPLANSSVVDFVGYSFFANCFEGAGAAPTPSTATIAVTRGDNGCSDTADNNADFSQLTAEPRNSSSSANICACGANVTANETGRADELDYCNIQFPLSISIGAGQATPLIYGRVYEAGITDPAGDDASILAEVGFGPENINPSAQSGFTYVPMGFNMQYGNDDEYQASLTAPATPGTYHYVVRFSRNGVSWTYCDIDGAGSNAGQAFNYQSLPVLDVTP